METQQKKQTDLTPDFTLDLVPFFLSFFFAQTQSLLSLSALCNHMSALLTFSKLFKKRSGRNVYSSLYLIFFLITSMSVRWGLCLLCSIRLYIVQSKVVNQSMCNRKKKQNAKLLSLCTSASQFYSVFKMLTADMANRYHWSKNLVALLSEICLEMIFLIIFALIPLGSVTLRIVWSHWHQNHVRSKKYKYI